MTQPTRPLALSAWLGFALACLFFYPLAEVIEAEPYYLQWRSSHAWEAAVAILMLAVGIGPLQLRQSGALEHTTVAIFSDHGFLGRGAEKDTRHVPFIVRSAGQTSRVDVTAEEPGEMLLRSLVDRCGS